MKRIASAVLLTLLLWATTSAVVINGLAWSNGGYSSDPANPDYGTHDWIAEHALDWLPDQEKQYIVNNLTAYLYGTELPDNGGAPDGIGDTTKHHVYYNSAEVMTDDAAAVRASTEYSSTLSYLEAKDFEAAAKDAGIMSHYIVDVAVFGHVMGSGTDWGAEVHHSDYETYVNERTSSCSAEFNSYLSFDGSLTPVSAYDGAKNLAYDTTFDVDGDLTCVWMDQNYDWNNPAFKNRAGESLNLAVNYLTDVLHTLYQEAALADSSPPSTFHDYDGSWQNTDFTVTLTATDDLSGVNQTYYKINDGPTKTVSTDEQPLIATEGDNNKLEYWSKDKAGNEELPHKILTGIKLDKTAPTGSVTINDNTIYSTSTSVTLTLTSTDTTSGVYQGRYSNDGVWDTETWETSSPTKAWTLTSGDGSKTVYYQIKDNAGLVSITYSDTITLDTTPPTGSMSINDGATYTTANTVTLTILATDGTSGIAEMRFSNDNTTYTEWKTYATSESWSLSVGDGTKTVYVQFKDNAGLISQPYFDAIILDTTTPNIVITSPSPGYQLRSSTVSVTWTCSDETSGVSHYEIRLDGGSWTNIGTNTTYTFTGLGEGSHTIDVKAVDNVGNTKQDTVDFIINTSPLFGPGYNEEAAITATIIIAALGIALYLFKIRKH